LPCIAVPSWPGSLSEMSQVGRFGKVGAREVARACDVDCGSGASGQLARSAQSL